MPSRQRRPPAPRTVLQRYTVRLDRREARLGFLIQPVPEGADIYEIARRNGADNNTYRNANGKAEAAAVAAAKQRHKEEDGPGPVGTNADGNQYQNADDGGRQTRYGQPAPPPPKQQQLLLAPSVQAAALRTKSSASEPKSAPPVGAPSNRDGGAAGESGAGATSTDAIADRAEAVTKAAVLDAMRLAKAARVEGEEAELLAALASRNDESREILMEESGVACVAADEDAAVSVGSKSAMASASATKPRARPPAAASGQNSGENTAEATMAVATNEADAKAEVAPDLKSGGGGAVMLDKQDAPITNQRPSRRAAATGAMTAAATASAAAPTASTPAPARAKRTAAKRLTIMPGSPALKVAADIRRWRQWCEAEYARRQGADEEEVVADNTYKSDADDANGSEDSPFTTLPHPSVFDTLDGTIAAALEAGIFNDTAMYKQKINRTSLRSALVGAIQVGDYIESLRLQSPAKSYAYQMNGLRRYISPTAQEQVAMFGEYIKVDRNYPLYVTYCRKVVIYPPPPMDLTGTATAGSGSKRSHPVESFDSGPAKRRRKADVIGMSGASAKAIVPPPPPPKQDNVIDLLDSSDEEDDDTAEEEKKECMEVEETEDVQAIEQRPSSKVGCDGDEAVALTEDSPSSPKPPALLIRPLPVALPDPTAIFHVGDFVLTKYGPGKVLSSRVDRFPETEQFLVAPILMYSIALQSGYAHIPSTELRAVEGSEYTEKRILTYRNITLNKMDLLRLWPLTYLNDSLVNFYIKYMVMEKISATGGSLSVDDCHVFPTYFYSRISHLQNGGTAYRDTKASRKKLYQDVKGWTKGTDVFKKRFLIFPINFDLHWTFVLAVNPGDVLKVIPPPPAPRKKKGPRAAPAVANPEVDAIVIDDKPAAGTDVAVVDISSIKMSSVGQEPASAPDAVLACNAARQEGEDVAQIPADEDQMQIDSLGTVEVETDTLLLVNQKRSETATAQADVECDTATAAAAAAKRSDPSLAPCLIHFDSGRHFKLHRSTTIFKQIRKYLAACYEATKAEEFPLCNITPKTLPGFSPPIPQQENAKDCGVYTLEFIERVLADPPNIDASFIKRKGLVKDGPFGADWFDKEVISKKRVDMTRLIRELEIREYDEIVI